MPDRIDPPRFDRLFRRLSLTVWLWLLTVFVVLPLAVVFAHYR